MSAQKAETLKNLKSIQKFKLQNVFNGIQRGEKITKIYLLKIATMTISRTNEQIETPVK